MFKWTVLTLSYRDSAERQELSCVSVPLVSALMFCMFCTEQDQNLLLLKDSVSRSVHWVGYVDTATKMGGQVSGGREKIQVFFLREYKQVGSCILIVF